MAYSDTPLTDAHIYEGLHPQQMLNHSLSDGRAEDLKRFASDKENQMQLLKEYGLM